MNPLTKLLNASEEVKEAKVDPNDLLSLPKDTIVDLKIPFHGPKWAKVDEAVAKLARELNIEAQVIYTSKGWLSAGGTIIASGPAHNVNQFMKLMLDGVKAYNR